MSNYFHESVLPELSEQAMPYFYQMLKETFILFEDEETDDLAILFQKHEFGDKFISTEYGVTLYVPRLKDTKKAEEMAKLIDFLGAIESLVGFAIKDEYVYDNDIFSHDKVDYQFKLNPKEDVLSVLEKFLKERYFSFLEKYLLNLHSDSNIKEFMTRVKL